MPPFRYVQPVRFGDIDHAGIVYYPRFFHWFHVAFEELFGRGEYVRILDQRKIGFPAVHVEVDFVKPLRYGDQLEVAIHLQRLGDRSVSLRYVVTRVEGGDRCAEAVVTCATIDMATFKTVPVPDDLRRLFESLT